jgi:hypothetical protein
MQGGVQSAKRGRRAAFFMAAMQERREKARGILARIGGHDLIHIS